ncbi:MAG TPA: PAS domain S-box protein, partial [Methanoregulaceae archaeon]|nr:PAS domain S-box protein [Methanoregulaceae archaeon]
RSIEQGATDFLPKPVDPVLLRARLTSSITLKRYHDRQREHLAEISALSGRLRAVIEGGGVGIALIDREGRFIETNPALHRMLGDESGASDGGRFEEWLDPSNRADGVALLGEAFRTRERPIGREFSFRRRDGTLVWGSVSLSVVRDPGTGTDIAVMMIEDVTERRLYAEALRRANEKLNVLNTMTRHDISNQLTSAMGYLALLREQNGDPSLEPGLDRLERALAQVRQQLAFTRDYQEIGVQSPVWHPLGATIRRAVGPLDPPGLFIECADVEVYADPMLERVFYTLVENTLRHGGTVTACRFSTEQRGDDLVIVYTDDGIGIPVAEKERIFERGVGKNTGFGLFLAREILSFTGLEIEEHGVPGAGVRFEIRVPPGAFRAG